MNNKQCLTMIRGLQEMVDTKGGCIEDTLFGICIYLRYEISLEYLESWEHFSGYGDYPVVDTEDERHAEVQYEEIGNLWRGRQLELRLSLAAHLLKCYKEYYIENFS